MPLSFESLRLDNAHLLADPVEHTRTVELANARALELGLVQDPPDPPVSDLGEFVERFNEMPDGKAVESAPENKAITVPPATKAKTTRKKAK